MGLLEDGDWKGDWICARDYEVNEGESVSPWLRKGFAVEGKVDRGLVYIASAGYHELWVNGRKVTESILSPAVSVLSKRIFYVTYDVAEYLCEGKNVIGVWLGRGWNTCQMPGVVDERPAVRVQGNLFVGEERREVVSDGTWECAKSCYTTLGPWEWNDHGGERLDMRLDNKNWCTLEDDMKWDTVEAAGRDAALTSQLTPLNRIGKEIAAVSCIEDEDGNYIIDFGTDLAGWMKLKIPGMSEGQKVTIRYRQSAGGKYNCEGAVDDCSFTGNAENRGGWDYNQYDEFISAGRENEEFVSKFNYRGFKTVLIKGLKEKPALSDAAALLIESDLEPAGSFECSNELLNRIYRLNMWTIRCLNLAGYMVDCPHRERLGYGGDGQVSVEGCVMNLRMGGFYAKWLRDWVDVQLKTGEVPFSTPYHPPAGDGDFGREGPPAWGGFLVAVAWKMYLYYADREILQEIYKPMLRFMERLESHTVDGILRGYGDKWQRIGDWVPVDRGMDTERWPSDEMNEFFNNCYRVYLWELMERSAKVLGFDEDAERYRDKIEEVRNLIHAEFYDEEKGYYVCDEQAYLLMPLMTGVVPDQLREGILKRLVDAIVVKSDGHLDTGMHGTYFLFQYLSEIGRDDLLFMIANQKTYPGWGYMLEKGATTVWEQWNGEFSRIHACFISVAGWFTNALAGIRADPAGAGFKKIIIKPKVVGDITWVKGRHECIYGSIVSEWKIEGGKLMLDVTIPANTAATVYIPTTNPESVTESENFLRMDGDYAVCEVGSGHWRFCSEF